MASIILLQLTQKRACFFTTVGNVNAMLTKSYTNQEGVPSYIIFTFDKKSGKYSIASMNTITDEIQWSHDVICKY